MGFSESLVAGPDGNRRPMNAFDHRFSFDLHADPPAQSRINDPSIRAQGPESLAAKTLAIVAEANTENSRFAPECARLLSASSLWRSLRPVFELSNAF